MHNGIKPDPNSAASRAAAKRKPSGRPGYHLGNYRAGVPERKEDTEQRFLIAALRRWCIRNGYDPTWALRGATALQSAEE